MKDKKYPIWKNPDELITFAESSTSPPPQDEIPKQKVPGWIRWPIRAIFLPFVLLDLLCQKFVRFFFKTPYKQVGKCNKRGNCCYFILTYAPTNWLKKLYYFWITEINGFYPRQQKPLIVDNVKFKVMGCRYFKKNGECSHYRLRPMICRQWPVIEYFGPPKILKGCGYKAVPRNKNFDPYPQDKIANSEKLNVLNFSRK